MSCATPLANDPLNTSCGNATGTKTTPAVDEEVPVDGKPEEEEEELPTIDELEIPVLLELEETKSTGAPRALAFEEEEGVIGKKPT